MKRGRRVCEREGVEGGHEEGERVMKERRGGQGHTIAKRGRGASEREEGKKGMRV